MSRPTSPPGTEKWLHDDCALIVDFAQSAENLRPRHPATPGRTTIGFAEVEMTQPGSGLNDGIPEAVFFDVHVEGVEKNFAVGATDPFSKGNTFGCDVHHELLEAIDDFDAKEDVAIFGGFNRFAHALESAVGEDLFVFAGQQLAWPGAVIDAGQYGAAQVFHRSRHVLKKSDAFFPRRGVLRGQVHIGFQAMLLSETQARIRSRTFEGVPLGIAH